MDTIKLIIDYNDEITLNNEYTTRGPLEMTWFPSNDLILKIKERTVTINCDNTLAGRTYKLPSDVFFQY